MFQTSVLRTLCGRCATKFRVQSVIQKRQYSLYEPPYLDKGPQAEIYPLLLFQLRAYDYAVLESFSKYVHNLVKRFGIKNDAFAVPTRSAKVTLFKPNSTVPAQEYDLKLQERTIQIEMVPSTILPLMLEVVQNNLPEGVQMTLKEFNRDEDDFRYVTDTELLELRRQVDEAADSIREYKSR